MRFLFAFAAVLFTGCVTGPDSVEIVDAPPIADVSSDLSDRPCPGGAAADEAGDCIGPAAVAEVSAESDLRSIWIGQTGWYAITSGRPYSMCSICENTPIHTTAHLSVGDCKFDFYTLDTCQCLNMTHTAACAPGQLCDCYCYGVVNSYEGDCHNVNLGGEP